MTNSHCRLWKDVNNESMGTAYYNLMTINPGMHERKYLPWDPDPWSILAFQALCAVQKARTWSRGQPGRLRSIFIEEDSPEGLSTSNIRSLLMV